MCLNIRTHVHIYRCASMFVSVWMLVHMPVHMFIFLTIVVINDNDGGDGDGLMMMDGDDSADFDTMVVVITMLNGEYGSAGDGDAES